PKARFAVSKSATTDDGSVTSVGTARAREPADSDRATVSASPSGRRPASTTEYPSRRRARAAARPIPDPAPVTIAVFPIGFLTPAVRSGASHAVDGPGPLDRGPCGRGPV